MRTKFCLLLTTLLMYFALSAQTQYILLTGQSNAVAVAGTTLPSNDTMMWTIGSHTIRNFAFDSNYTHQMSRVKGPGFSSNNLMLGGVGSYGLGIQKYIKDSLGLKSYLVNGGHQGQPIKNFLCPANRYDCNTAYGRVLLRCYGGGIQDSISTVIYYQYESDCSTRWQYYAARFDSLYRTWHRDYPSLKKIVYVSGRPILGTNRDYQVEMRELQRTFSKIYPDVVTVTCAGIKALRTDGIHFEDTGYYDLANRTMRVLLHPWLQTDVDSAVLKWPPYVKYADGYVNIHFNYPVSEFRGEAADSVKLSDYIFFNNGAKCIALTYNGNVLSAHYQGATAPTKVWYLPVAGYTGYGTGSEARYKGPWLRASTGIDFPGFKIDVKS